MQSDLQKNAQFSFVLGQTEKMSKIAAELHNPNQNARLQNVLLPEVTVSISQWSVVHEKHG